MKLGSCVLNIDFGGKKTTLPPNYFLPHIYNSILIRIKITIKLNPKATVSKTPTNPKL